MMTLTGKFPSLGVIFLFCSSTSAASEDAYKARNTLCTSESTSPNTWREAIEDEDGQRALHLLQLRGSRKSGNGCPAPDPTRNGAFSTTAKACPHPGDNPESWSDSCLDGNRGFYSLWDAWEKCGITEGCGAVMDYGNGLFYLRRESDPDDPTVSTAKVFVYACEAKAQEDEEIREAARAEADKEIEKERFTRVAVLKEKTILKDGAAPANAINQAELDVESAVHSAEDAAESAKLATEVAQIATRAAESALREAKDANRESALRAAERALEATRKAENSNVNAQEATEAANSAITEVNEAANLAEAKAERETEQAVQRLQVETSHALTQWGDSGPKDKDHRGEDIEDMDLEDQAAEAIQKAKIDKAIQDVEEADWRKAKVEETMENAIQSQAHDFQEIEEQRDMEHQAEAELQKARTELAVLAENTEQA
mmetsp:Transcript_105896/g.192658  ORF Transcript_105896/g.192658 Transcript_105896/m.192658 type:complete len:430 (+) Transcript_105896:57-1346(+)